MTAAGRGHRGSMTQNSEPTQDDARTEALHRVVERVNGWQETATDGTIAEELDKGLREAGVTLTDEQREHVVEQISHRAEVDFSRLSTAQEGGPA